MSMMGTGTGTIQGRGLDGSKIIGMIDIPTIDNRMGMVIDMEVAMVGIVGM